MWSQVIIRFSLLHLQGIKSKKELEIHHVSVLQLFYQERKKNHKKGRRGTKNK